MIFQERNAPYPQPIYACPVNKNDGTGFSTGITAYHVTTDPVTGESVRVEGAGELTHVGGGLNCYVPTQAETDYENYAIHFWGSAVQGYGQVVQVTTCSEPLRREVERLFGVRQWNIRNKSALITPGDDDGGMATWPWVMWDSFSEVYRCYYTAGNGLTIRMRTSDDLIHWSGWRLVHHDLCYGSGPWSTECPHVVFRRGYYYLFRTEHYSRALTHVFRSEDPFDFGIGDASDRYVGRIAVAAPEIIVDRDGNEYITSNHDLLAGTRICRLRWEPV